MKKTRKKKTYAILPRLRAVLKGSLAVFRAFLKALLTFLRKLAAGIGGFFSKMSSFLARRRLGKRMLGVALASAILFTAVGLCALAVSGAVKHHMNPSVMTVEELAASGEEYDCVLVLGCRVYEDGRMSDMLVDRVRTGVALIQAGVSDTLLMSGDHRTDAYDEPTAMKSFAVEQGITSARIFLDHDGYSTYESVMRLHEVFGGKRVVIVTQEYHLYRALYLAEKLGMEAVGVPADLRTYAGQFLRDVREVLARCKDVYIGLKQPASYVSGEKILLSGNGDLTASTRPSEK